MNEMKVLWEQTIRDHMASVYHVELPTFNAQTTERTNAVMPHLISYSVFSDKYSILNLCITELF